MPIHKSSDYKLSAVKYNLSHSKNQAQSCKKFTQNKTFTYCLRDHVSTLDA